MTLKRFIILTALTLLWILPSLAQSVEVKTLVSLHNGEEQLYVLDENDLLSFEGQQTLLITNLGTTHRIPIDDIRKIEFVDITDTHESQTNTPFLYPNPVERYLILGNIEEGQTVSVYSLEGRLLLELKANANEPIDLGNLPSGLYILRILDKNLKLLKR
ncbi:MAG: T9SS type A sorting domain-containing protein [Bacteroidales bacterium]|nr:T9SS type A sorting domain-containing protein [Bacteroidales bacterium]